MYYLCSENEGADQPANTAQLICTFVFTYAKSLFSHEAAHSRHTNNALILDWCFCMLEYMGVSLLVFLQK